MINRSGATWRVVSTHLGLASPERRAQVVQVSRSFNTPATSLILLGDVNAGFIYGRTLRRLVSHFHRMRSPRTCLIR
jgi:endonuclease/exonuclease/phosphatase family metal-dependent hydrolase